MLINVSTAAAVRHKTWKLTIITLIHFLYVLDLHNKSEKKDVHIP